MDIRTLKKALEQSWQPQTSYEPTRWSLDNPSWGQCAVTALIVQDHLGGEIVYADAQLPDGKTIPHYFNRLPMQHKTVDLTRGQFPAGTRIPKGHPQPKDHPTTRDYVLSYEQTQFRYHLLKQNVERRLLERSR